MTHGVNKLNVKLSSYRIYSEIRQLITKFQSKPANITCRQEIS